MADSMWDVLKFFDAYTIRARILPALIAGLPSLALPFTIVPWSHFGLSNVVVTTMSFILLYAFADVARRGGHRIEKKLGTRATPELWHRSNVDLPNSSKDQFRSFVASKIKQESPTKIEEIENPKLANDFYNGAGAWLRENTRDKKKFNILFDELLTYGFRRNLLGLKFTSLLMNLIVICIVISILYFEPLYFKNIEHIEEKMISISVVIFLHSIYMIFAVNKEAVREASKSYGKQLILSCGALMKSPSPSRKNL